MTLRAAIVTASNRASLGVYSDTSGEVLREGLQALSYDVVSLDVVPDDIDAIRAALKKAIKQGVDLLVTTGGTGVSPTDVTPQATAPLLDYEIPGISEALRAYSRERVPTTDLSRGLAGLIGDCLVINLPGSPGGVRDGLVVIERLAGHVHDQRAGKDH